jgi:hypothetical protein
MEIYGLEQLQRFCKWTLHSCFSKKVYNFAFLFLQKSLQNSYPMVNGLCIFVNLAKSWDGLTYMQARDRLDIPSHALLPRALFPPTSLGFLFWILASQFYQTVGDNLFFLFPILILELANSIFCQTKNAKPWSC